MLHRSSAHGTWLISQPAHAWVSGQLARAWGNDSFGTFFPREEVCLAAEQHDIGFLAWEQAPTFNPDTGLPHSFMNLPTGLHLELWARGVEQLLRFNRYAALLVSMHYTALRKRQAIYNSEDGVREEAAFLSRQTSLQQHLGASLRSDPRYAQALLPDIIERNLGLIAAWDWMSLHICLGWQNARNLPHVPTLRDTAQIELQALDEDRMRFAVSPWPFQQNSAEVLCDAWHIQGECRDEAALRALLAQGATTTLRFCLQPA